MTDGTPVIAAQRVDSGDSADLSEITELARAAGYEVVATLAQSRTADAAYHSGERQAEALAGLVA